MPHSWRMPRTAAVAAAALVGLMTVQTSHASAGTPRAAVGHAAQAGTFTADPTPCKLPATSAYLSEGFGTQGTPGPFAPSTGTVKATMIFVDFPDAPADDTTSQLFSEYQPGASNWLSTSSYGRLNLQVVEGSTSFFRMPADSTSYGFQRNLTSQTHLQYIQDALNAVGRSVSFTGSQLLFIVPTSAATAISFSPTYMGSVTAADGTVIGHTITFGQDISVWHYPVLDHEISHTMGLPDLYPFSGGATTQYVGGWDLLGLISGPAPDHFAWHKWKLGWIDDSQVDCVSQSGTSTHTLTPLETSGGTKMTVVKTSATRAIVAEDRQALGLDTATCATGVLIYTVDTTVATGDGPIQVQDARPNSGGCDGAELNDATFGFGTGQISTFHDSVSGATITVTGRQGTNYTISVTL